MNILDILEQLKSGDLETYHGYAYIGEYASKDEAVEYSLSMFNISEDEVIFYCNDSYDGHYVFTNEGIKQFIDDNQFSDDFIKCFKNNALIISSVEEDDSDILYELEGESIDKYIDYQKTAQKFMQDFDIIQLDDDYYISEDDEGNMNHGHVYSLSRKTIEEDLNKYPQLARCLSSVDKSTIDLSTMQDNIGDTIDFYDNIDLYNRNRPFIYVNGELSIADSNCSHTELLNSIYDTSLTNTTQIVKVDNISEKIDADVVAFGTGQIIDNVAIIDLATCEHCSIDDIANQLKNHVNKVYTTSDRHELTRVAKIKKD